MILGILISFALIGHVLLVTELDDYMKEVLLINDDIKQAKKFMPEIIKNMVSNYEEYGSEEMAYMLAVPEMVDVKLSQWESDTESDDNTEDTLEVAEILAFMSQVPVKSQIPESDSDTGDNNQIPLVNLFPGEGPSQYRIPDLNLDPSAVSKEASKSKNPNFVGITIIDLEKKFQFQKMMKLEILAVTDRPKFEEMVLSARYTDPTRMHSLDPNRPSDHATNGRNFEEVPQIKLENLASVIEKRRIRPSNAPNRRLVRAFGLDSLARARREITLEAVTSLIRRNDSLFLNLYMMCRLVGVFKSIKYPRSYILDLDIIDDHYCGLTDVTNVDVYVHVYRFFGDEFWEVELNGYARIKPFLSELE